jgi:hypothetical protein
LFARTQEDETELKATRPGKNGLHRYPAFTPEAAA